MDSFEAFISYRRQGGKELAEALPRLLEEKYGISSFLDNEALHFGDFRTQLIQNNLFSRVLIVLLSPGALDRCKNKGDWVAREITLFLKLRKPMVLIEFEGFTFPDELPEPLERLKDMPKVHYVPGQDLEDLVRRIVMVLRRRWVQEVDQEAIAQLVTEQLPLCKNLCASEAAEKITKKLLHKHLITKEEAPKVQSLMLPIVEGTQDPDPHAESLQLAHALADDRLTAVTLPAKQARDAACAEYGVLVENHDKDTLAVRQQRASRVAPFFGYMFMLLLLAIPAFIVRLDGLERLLPMAIFALVLLFCEKRGRFETIFHEGKFIGKLFKLLGSVIGGALLYVFIPVVLLALLTVVMQNSYPEALAVILVTCAIMAAVVPSGILVYKAAMKTLHLLNAFLHFHFSAIYLGKLRLERSGKYARIAGWILSALVLVAAVFYSLHLLKGGQLI